MTLSSIGRRVMSPYHCTNISLLVSIFNGKFSCSNGVAKMYIGSCAGIMEHVGMFPLDTVKVSTIKWKGFAHQESVTYYEGKEVTVERLHG